MTEDRLKEGRNVNIQQIMKPYSHSSRNALVLVTTCVLFLSQYASSQAMAADARSRRADAASSHRGDAHLVIRRIPNLGNHVIVDVYVDGAAFATIGFGHTFEGSLTPGRHVLSVLATPGPKWTTPWQMTLDARSGQTYNFTAMGDHSGAVILKGG